MKEDLCPAAEWLNVAGVFGNKGNDFLGDSVFAAQVSKWSNHEMKFNFEKADVRFARKGR